MNPLCLACGIRKAQKVEPYGWMSCKNCIKRQRNTLKPAQTIEMVPESTKTDRKIYHDDILQPFREGVLSKEYLKKYGTKTIKVTPEDIKNAKEVWGENSYYKGEG